MWGSLAMMAVAGAGAGLGALPAMENAAVLEQATPVLRWVRFQGHCERGYALDGPEPVEVAAGGCGAELVSSRSSKPVPMRKLRRVLDGKPVRGLELIGDYRWVVVREIVRFPYPEGSGWEAGTGGHIVYALDPGSLSLRTVTRHGGGTQVLCRHDDNLPCSDLEDLPVLPWRAPEPWRGLSVLGGVDHDPTLAASLAELEDAALATVRQLDAGGEVRRLRDPWPETPPLTTKLGVQLTFTLTREDADPERWRLEIPTALLGEALHAERTFPEVGLHVELDIDPSGGGSLRWTGPDGEPHTRQFRILARTARMGEARVLVDQPEVQGLPDIARTGVPDWFRLSPYGLRRMEHPVDGPKGVDVVERPIADSSPDPAAEPPVSTELDPSVVLESRVVQIPQGVRVVLRSGDAFVQHSPVPDTEPVQITVDPRRPVRRRARVHLGQAPPQLDQAPDLIEEVELELHDGRLFSLHAGERWLLDHDALEAGGAWVVYEWHQGDRAVAFRAYRLPPGRRYSPSDP